MFKHWNPFLYNNDIVLKRTTWDFFMLLKHSLKEMKESSKTFDVVNEVFEL